MTDLDQSLIITKPKRHTICELFPISENYQLDAIGKRELRTVNEFWLLFKRICDQNSDLRMDPPNPFHLNTITTEFLNTLNGRPMTDLDHVTLVNRVEERLMGATTDQMLYYMHSAYFMGLMRNVGRVTPAGAYLTSENLAVSKSSLVFVGELAVIGSVLRKYPFIRFDVMSFVQFRIHYEGELERDGCPRISIDGYANV